MNRRHLLTGTLALGATALLPSLPAQAERGAFTGHSKYSNLDFFLWRDGRGDLSIIVRGELEFPNPESFVISVVINPEDESNRHITIYPRNDYTVRDAFSKARQHVKTHGDTHFIIRYRREI